MIRTILLLFASNTFMTLAWYGHLRFKTAPLWIAIAVSWLIALPEYALQVPANRLGYISAGLNGYQLKILQEGITLVVFMVFAWFALGETPTWRSGAALVLVFLAVLLVSTGRPTPLQ